MSRVRWWPAGLVLGLGALWLLRVWLLSDVIRQEKVIRTIAGTGVALILLLLWLVLLSRLPGRARAAWALAFLALAGGTAALFRIRGVTGDLVPILEPRWRARSGAEVRRAPSPPSSSPAVIAVEPAPPAALPSASPSTSAVPATVARAGGDYPQFLGPDRNGVLPDVRLARSWSARGPRRIWRHRVGPGWSGFALSGSWAVTQEQHGEDETVVAYDLRSGVERWRHADPAHYQTTIAGEGPRATPTVSGDRVFTLGATGMLNALDLRTGALLWRRHVLKENGG